MWVCNAFVLLLCMSNCRSLLLPCRHGSCAVTRPPLRPMWLASQMRRRRPDCGRPARHGHCWSCCLLQLQPRRWPAAAAAAVASSSCRHVCRHCWRGSLAFRAAAAAAHRHRPRQGTCQAPMQLRRPGCLHGRCCSVRCGTLAWRRCQRCCSLLGRCAMMCCTAPIWQVGHRGNAREWASVLTWWFGGGAEIRASCNLAGLLAVLAARTLRLKPLFFEAVLGSRRWHVLRCYCRQAVGGHTSCC